MKEELKSSFEQETFFARVAEELWMIHLGAISGGVGLRLYLHGMLEDRFTSTLLDGVGFCKFAIRDMELICLGWSPLVKQLGCPRYYSPRDIFFTGKDIPEETAKQKAEEHLVNLREVKDTLSTLIQSTREIISSDKIQTCIKTLETVGNHYGEEASKIDKEMNVGPRIWLVFDFSTLRQLSDNSGLE